MTHRTKPPDARTVNPGQEVTYHGAAVSGVVRIFDGLESDEDRFARRVLAVIASPAGQAAIRAAMTNPLVGRRCRVHGNTFTAVHVEWDGSVLVRGDDSPSDWQPIRVPQADVEWIDEGDPLGEY